MRTPDLFVGYGKRLSVLVLLMAMSVLLLSGCGEKAGVASDSSKSEQSQACITCHRNAVSPVTGKPIAEEWKLSRHNTSNGAGCGDCHEPEVGHPSDCNLCHGGLPPTASNRVSKNPDEDQKCKKCHGVSGVFPRGTRRDHYGGTNASAAFGGYTAAYVSTNYIGNCRKCHNPHDPSSAIEYNRAWARSGHGNVAAGSRTARDFKLYGTNQTAALAYSNYPRVTSTDSAVIAAGGTPVCVRCHTTTGYINFVESGFQSLRPFGSSLDKSKEVTGCDACHSGYGFSLRKVGRVKIYFNFSSMVSHAVIRDNVIEYPDLGASNLCVPCHAGRGLGGDIKKLSGTGVDFSMIDSPGAHDFSGAGLLTATSGYEFAGKNYTTGAGAITGHDTAGRGSGKGPCITCHMNKNSAPDSHTFKPVVHDAMRFDLYTANRTWSQVYSVSSNSPASLKVASLTSRSCNTSGCHAGLDVAKMNSDKEGYISALAALNQWVRLVRNVPVDASAACADSINPPRRLTKWNYPGSVGQDLMGAAFNLSLLNNEPGAYVHNPLYAKRLVYDSIAYLMLAESQTDVASAIGFLVGNTKLCYLLKSGKVAGSAICSDYNANSVAITPHQANAAIGWLYGSIPVAPSDRIKRPGDN